MTRKRRKAEGGISEARVSRRVQIGLILGALTVALFGAHLALFRDVKTLLFYLALDVVFVPIQVLLVTVIIERLLSERERQAMIRKLNMVVGAFFGEAGHELIRHVVAFSLDGEELANRLNIQPGWTEREYAAARVFAQAHPWRLAPTPAQLRGLRELLLSRRNFILGLLQSPNVLEHQMFTDLLWAVSHLTEELEARTDILSLPKSDVEHLAGDVRRAFGILVREWLAYMQHLEAEYPYMYSLAVRTNPFRPGTSAIVV